MHTVLDIVTVCTYNKILYQSEPYHLLGQITQVIQVPK